MRLIENYVARAEQLLNPVDWIPYVACYSGMVRILAGAVQIVAGIIFAYLKIVHNLLSSKRARICQAIEQGYFYSLHGVANILRGAIAIFPGLNLLLLLHDQKLGRFNYPQEQVRPGVYPIATAHKLTSF